MAEESKSSHEETIKKHWQRTSRLVWSLVAIWFIASFIPPLFAPTLNQISFFGWPFGYWFSAQVTLATFIILLIINAKKSDKIDKEFGLHEEEEV
ncbi:MAG: hypothetical protein DDT18_01989 [Actinobacteria bacterium]|nr:hypothetical protein [Actinomycetota bacterium]